MTALYQFEYTQHQKKRMCIAKLLSYLSSLVVVIGLSGVQFGLQSYFVTKSMITDQIGPYEVLLLINSKEYNLREEKYSLVKKER